MFRRDWLVFFAVGAVVGCSLLLKDDAIQCSSDEDCTARGPEFKDAVCNKARSVCEVPHTNTGGTGGTGGGSGGSAGSSQCTENKECTTGGPLVCIKGSCVLTTSTECPKLIGQTLLPNSGNRLIAMIAPLGGSISPEDLFGQATVNALTAYSDAYNNQEPTLQELDSVTVVVCNEGADPTKPLDHLQELEIKYIVGPQTVDGLFKLLPLVKDRQMAMLSPLINELRAETDPAALQGVADGNYFSLRPNRKRELGAYAPALEKARQLLAAAIPGTQFSSLKPVVIWNKNNPDSIAYKDELKKLPIASSWTYMEYTGAGSETTLANAVKTAAPNLVATASADDAFADVFAAIDLAYSTVNDKPYYFVPGEPGKINDKISQSQLSKRFFALSVLRPTASNDAFKNFLNQYSLKFKKAVPAKLTEIGVDAYLFSIYLDHAIKKDETTPAKIRTTLLELARPPGPAISLYDFGTVASDVVAFPSDAAADFFGASGNLDIDPTLGSPEEKFSLRCFATSGTDFCDTGYAFDSKGTLSGAPNTSCVCP